MKQLTTVLLFAAFALAAAAQTPAPPSANPLLAEAKTAFDRIKGNILKAADAMPDDAYSFSPTKDERPFLQVAAHVADAQAGGCSGVKGGDPVKVDAAKATTKADLIAKLKASFDVCDAAFASATDATATDTSKGRSKLSRFYGLVAHNQEQYAIMAAYMRQKGVKPPTAQN
jgi:hypothetical protein